MGSNPIESTKFKFMESFYTKLVSDEVVKSLHSVNFPFAVIDGGFTVPQIVEVPPTYAEVFD